MEYSSLQPKPHCCDTYYIGTATRIPSSLADILVVGRGDISAFTLLQLIDADLVTRFSQWNLLEVSSVKRHTRCLSSYFSRFVLLSNQLLLSRLIDVARNSLSDFVDCLSMSTADGAREAYFKTSVTFDSQTGMDLSVYTSVLCMCLHWLFYMIAINSWSRSVCDQFQLSLNTWLTQWIVTQMTQ